MGVSMYVMASLGIFYYPTALILLKLVLSVE